MPIDTICPGCQAQLRIDEEFAGQIVRCPACDTIYTAFAAPVAKIRHNLCDRQKRIMSIGSAWYRGDKFTLDIKREQALAVRGPRRKG